MLIVNLHESNILKRRNIIHNNIPMPLSYSQLKTEYRYERFLSNINDADKIHFALILLIVSQRTKRIVL